MEIVPLLLSRLELLHFGYEESVTESCYLKLMYIRHDLRNCYTRAHPCGDDPATIFLDELFEDSEALS